MKTAFIIIDVQNILVETGFETQKLDVYKRQDIFSASFDKFTSLYMVANYATMGSLSLYFVLSLAYELTKIYAEEEELNMNPLNGALLALMAFIMTVPQIIFDGGMMKAVGLSLIHI